MRVVVPLLVLSKDQPKDIFMPKGKLRASTESEQCPGILVNIRVTLDGLLYETSTPVSPIIPANTGV